ncbi:MAG: PAS domain S-box protein, partial [Thermodesulfobacteriota bacterium]
GLELHLWQPDAVFVQTEKKFAYLNSRAVHLFGAEKETDLLGRPVTDRFHPDYHEQILERICRLNEKRQPVIDNMEQKQAFRYKRLCRNDHRYDGAIRSPPGNNPGNLHRRKSIR